jgi:hypothetical protein
MIVGEDWTEDQLARLVACAMQPEREATAKLRESHTRLLKALRPFAAMDRGGVVKEHEVVLKRGTASDMTLVASQDFRNAQVAVIEAEAI